MSIQDAGVQAPLRPPPRAAFSIKAAMIVPGIGALILAAFIGAGFLTSNPVKPTVTSALSFSVPGTSLRAEPAVKVLGVITVSGQPPGNIINATSIPVGATRISFQNNTAAAQSYDAQIELRMDASQAAVENFYRKDLKKQGWQIFETGPADNDPGAIEVLGKQAGSDGFYWEIGAVVSATTFGQSEPAGGSTDFTLRLLQQPDPD
jgi:hypothetical protein